MQKAESCITTTKRTVIKLRVCEICLRVQGNLREYSTGYTQKKILVLKFVKMKEIKSFKYKSSTVGVLMFIKKIIFRLKLVNKGLGDILEVMSLQYFCKGTKLGSQHSQQTTLNYL